MRIFVTGGAGYIGSHTIVELLASGHEVVSCDNFYNSEPSVNDRIRQISGKDFAFYNIDVTDRDALRTVFENERIDAVIHFAACKAVAESVEKPLMYYKNNLDSLISVCEVMGEYGCKNLVYSSSAAVYGIPDKVPLTEDSPVYAINPYGETKVMGERILRDLGVACPDMSITLLRYFNPIGAHESGYIGESPNGIPNNLLPRVAQVAYGILDVLPVTGNDYDTPDGTGIRDYIHVVDLAKGHIAALETLIDKPGVYTYNLGTGRGYSVLEIIAAMEKASGRKIKYEFQPRRPGDGPISYADASKAKNELGWVALYDMERMCADLCRWQEYFAANLR